MAGEDTVEVGVYIHLHNLDAARSDASDLAWEHSLNTAIVAGVDPGSPEHGELYQEMSRRYEHMVDHLLFFMQNSLTVLKALIDTGYLKLNVEDGPWTDEQASERMSHMAQLICSSYLWLAAGYEIMWPTNQELGNAVDVRFTFNSNEISEDFMEE